MYEALAIIFGVVGFIFGVAIVINSFVTKRRRLVAKQKDQNSEANQ
ncbi:MAG: hypothetical protein OEZ04_04590 [Nitrospinota bacterium]|nr:hypothetical protein [Nitrospinota bacterium]